MTSQSERRQSALINEVAKQVRARLKGKEAKAGEAFVRTFYAHVPPHDILHETPGNLAGAALAMWRFAARRSAEQPSIEVYTPTLKSHGWESTHTAVLVVNDDMPFLVDSVTLALNQLDAEVHLVIHPILLVDRDEGGRLKALAAPDESNASGRRESLMLVLISEQPEFRYKTIVATLQRVLQDVRVSVDDWREMRQRCRDILHDLERNPPRLSRGEISEAIDFLEWLNDDHFTYLGYREYHFSGRGRSAVASIDPASGLGLLRDADFSVFDGLRNLGRLPVDVQSWLKVPELLRISKANRRSTVHRSAHLDTVSVKIIDRRGQVVGERLFIGLFTSTAYSRSPRAIPLLRRKVENCIARAGFVPGSHDGKALMHILETYPRDELFQIDEDKLVEIAVGILHLQERQRTALFVRRDPFERFVSSLVYVPRDRFDTALRLRLQAILAAAYDGEISAFMTTLGDAPLARLHVTVKTEQGSIPEVDIPALERRLADAARSWSDMLETALVAEHGEQRGLELFRRYRYAFPSNYQEAFVAKDAVADIQNLETATTLGSLAMDLYRPHAAAESGLHFKIYVAGRPVPLSDVLPMLENMGLKVIGEVPYETRPGSDVRTIWIHDFEMELRSGGALDIPSVREAFHEVFGLVWTGGMEDDGFNRLVLEAGLTAREIRILRAYCKYLRQTGIPFSQAYMEDTLARNPELTRGLAELFMLRFDPAQRSGKQAAGLAKTLDGQVARIKTQLDDVANLDEDRIIRRYLNLIQNTLRTNYFQTAEDGGPKSYVSFKFDAQQLAELPLSRPFREIFVYSPRVEGVHLRFGLVARGGLRWSDRREDFRTEILGLVKAQQVKNAVIVPVGAKGGFVPKQLPDADAGREAWLNEGIECYKTFVRGLLDITDNLVGGKVKPPADTVRLDGDDPYLVVAADKGTATFSDIANGVSADYGFWLDDAFASGGSAGYDHKVMGITARGAWESVKRHFRELGKDTQSQDFTVVGVGDMSGDVFGNGMLLSKHIKLVGAFNHLHILVDPEPDPASSWAERKRLFDLPRSAWTDYESKLISKGGGVFERRAKSIKLTPEMQALFEIEADSVTPNELIQAMLKSPVELLWFGGIGTYVKAGNETHGEAGDRANDAIRVNAAELRCQVVGEGANLGMTQRGRIDYGLRGGRLNTDAIDNSAGVDCSDHEVNIKILLGAIEQDGGLTRRRRDSLLARMTDEVGDLVLRDNYLQTQSITVTHQLGAHLLDRLGRFMRSLERAGKLDREIEFLPDEEVLAERFNAGLGLTRPEIAVLLSYAKITLYDELLPAELPDDPYLNNEITRYFPTPLRKKYGAEIGRHRLRREIAATAVTNGVVNRMGIAFVHEVREKTGLPASDVCRAYLIAREIFDLRDLWAQIEGLDNKVPGQVQAAMLIECGRLTERIVVWLLRHCPAPLDIAGTIDALSADVGELVRGIGDLLHESERRSLAAAADDLQNQGVPVALARRVAALKLLTPACDIVRIAQSGKLPVLQVGRIYFDIGARFGLDWLRLAAGRLPSDSAWDKLATSALVDDLFGYQYDLTAGVLHGVSGDGHIETGEVVEAWADSRRPQVVRTEQLITELQATAKPDLAMLAVANRQLKSMVGDQ